MPFPPNVIDYLTSIGFEQETDSKISFIPSYKWEKFSLIITSCEHYNFYIYRKGNPLPHRIIFQGYRVKNINELTYLLSNNADFSKIFRQQSKNP